MRHLILLIAFLIAGQYGFSQTGEIKGPGNNIGHEKICPVCKKQDQVIPIIYGLPNKRLLRDARKGRVKLGGCEISENAPKWYCKRDKKEF